MAVSLKRRAMACAALVAGVAIAALTTAAFSGRLQSGERRFQNAIGMPVLSPTAF